MALFINSQRHIALWLWTMENMRKGKVGIRKSLQKNFMSVKNIKAWCFETPIAKPWA